MIHGAIFDQDGTMYDTERLYFQCWVQTVREFGLEPPFSLESHIHVAGSAGERMLSVLHDLYPAADPAALRDRAFELGMEAQRNGPPEKPGLHEAVDFLKGKGLRLAIGSSCARAQIERNLRFTGLTAAFDTIVGSDDIRMSKPDPEVFQIAARRIGCDPSECLVFEDSVNGIRAAHAAGCVPVLIPDCLPIPPDVRALAAVEVPDFFAAIEWLQKDPILGA